MHRIGIGIGLVAASLAAPARAQTLSDPAYTPTAVTYGGNPLDVGGINNSGVVGGFDSSTGYGYTLTPGGVYTPVLNDPSAANFSSVRGINDSGQTAGFYTDTSFNQVGFLLSADGKTPTTLSAGSGTTYPSGINNAGVVVGTLQDNAGNNAGFLYNPANPASPYTLFQDPLADGGTDARGINNAGLVVGDYVLGGTTYGFVRSADGTGYTTIAVPGAISTEVTGINDLGQVVGDYQSSDFANHGFLSTVDGTSFTTLDLTTTFDGSPGFATFLDGINDSGVIVGSYAAGEVTYGFLATPAAVPEPSSLALCGVAAALGLVVRLRPRRRA